MLWLSLPGSGLNFCICMYFLTLKFEMLEKKNKCVQHFPELVFGYMYVVTRLSNIFQNNIFLKIKRVKQRIYVTVKYLDQILKGHMDRKPLCFFTMSLDSAKSSFLKSICEIQYERLRFKFLT